MSTGRVCVRSSCDSPEFIEGEEIGNIGFEREEKEMLVSRYSKPIFNTRVVEVEFVDEVKVTSEPY